MGWRDWCLAPLTILQHTGKIKRVVRLVHEHLAHVQAKATAWQGYFALVWD